MKWRILYAEDNPMVGELQGEILEHAGYEVTLAEDGERAWECLVKSGADLLITDQQMPRLSGLELARRVRAAGLSLPIILVTGILDQLDAAQFAGLDIATTLRKPVSGHDFITTVNRALAPGSTAGIQFQYLALARSNTTRRVALASELITDHASGRNITARTLRPPIQRGV